MLKEKVLGFITEDGIVDILKMKVIARLGYNDYTLVEKPFKLMTSKIKGKWPKVGEFNVR